MGGQHRRDQAVVEEVADRLSVRARLAEQVDSTRQRRFAPRFGRCRPVLGEVGELGEQQEAANEAQRIAEIECGELAAERRTGRLATVAVRGDRGAADTLDRVKYRLPLDAADDVAEQTAEILHVLAVGGGVHAPLKPVGGPESRR